MGKHLVFYDGECGLCDKAVQFILQHDKKAVFDFAPLQGETAREWLNPPPKEDTVVLIEDYKYKGRKYIQSQAAFRSLWLLGGGWTVPGLLSYLPPVLFDWGYELMARNRKSLFKFDHCVIPNPADKHRFLP